MCICCANKTILPLKYSCIIMRIPERCDNANQLWVGLEYHRALATPFVFAEHETLSLLQKNWQLAFFTSFIRSIIFARHYIKLWYTATFTTMLVKRFLLLYKMTHIIKFLLFWQYMWVLKSRCFVRFDYKTNHCGKRIKIFSFDLQQLFVSLYR